MTMIYPFTENGSVSCLDISMPQSALELFADSVVVAVIQMKAESVFELGVVYNASINVEGVEGL